MSVSLCLFYFYCELKLHTFHFQSFVPFISLFKSCNVHGSLLPRISLSLSPYHHQAPSLQNPLIKQKIQNWSNKKIKRVKGQRDRIGGESEVGEIGETDRWDRWTEGEIKRERDESEKLRKWGEGEGKKCFLLNTRATDVQICKLLECGAFLWKKV